MEKYIEVRELTREEEKELKKMMPKLPKKKFSIKKVIKAIKNYDRVVNELDYITKISERRQQDIFRLQKGNSEKENLLVLKIKEIKRLEDKILEKEEKRRSNAGKVGSLTKKVSDLQEELELTKKELADTKEKLEESMTDKYIVKKLPSVKPPKVRMTTKPQKIKPATRKFMMNEFGK